MGVPTSPRSSNFTVIAKDVNGLTASQSYTLTIDKKSTVVSLAVSQNPIVIGQTVTITVTVAGDPPTGTVTLFDGAASLATLPLDANGTAAYAVNTLALGSHSITASYSGDANFLPAVTTAVLNLSVVSPPVPAPATDRWLPLVLAGLITAMVAMRRRQAR